MSEHTINDDIADQIEPESINDIGTDEEAQEWLEQIKKEAPF